MKYPNNDLWSVRQIEFLYDALKGYEGKPCVYHVSKTVQTVIANIATYNYVGVINFEGQDRTIILEQGKGYGLSKEQVIAVFREKSINYKLVE